ncbi:MAG: methionine ABC transporter permease [Advenella sp.]|jgi:D-methionine transport system permease protein|uniref:D-methionine transport system permease protein n=1 Tax=Advenella incenata TaxID=267800 RepID=A0A4Q7VEH7_9BURK|nr:methionine ABC transporter permease [Advenella incenata]RZT94013.1 D-methionine transport system permease protein [Advenella incenata]
MNWSTLDWPLIGEATIDTLLMTGWSLLWTVVIGLPLGVYLFLTSDRQLLANKPIYQSVSLLVNILRSVPFLILLIVLIPFTRLIMGSALGVGGAIPPLVVGAAPFFARLVENVLRELDPGISEACRAMGANSRQTVLWALLPEATTGIISAVVVTTIMLISYSAMSGVIGGGGLGDLAIRFGYQRYQTEVMIITVVILILMVQLVQTLGDYLVQHFNRK